MASPYIFSFWKPLHVPSAHAFYIFNNDFKILEVDGSNSIKAHIEED